MSDLDGSNALVSVVQFYSVALAREVQARQQSEALLKKILEKAEQSRKVLNDFEFDPNRQVLVDLARQMAGNVMSGTDRISRAMCEALVKAADEYDRSKLDRVEPDPSCEGTVRGAPADGSSDVPG